MVQEKQVVLVPVLLLVALVQLLLLVEAEANQSLFMATKETKDMWEWSFPSTRARIVVSAIRRVW